MAVSLSMGQGEPGAGGLVGRPLLLSAHPAQGTARPPADICCIIDVSWSMSMEASVKTSSGNSESNGLSMLDIAKHAVRAVVQTLSPTDRLCVIQFCKKAELVLPLTAMDDAGKAEAESLLDSMTFGSGTCLWQGINLGFEELRKNLCEDRLRHTLLLTDGETEDAADIMKNLEAAKAKHGGMLPGDLNTFGFGYEIDSPLLVKIATFSDGSYAFIPDAGFVGTIFVNAISTLLGTVSLHGVLRVEPASAIIQVLGGWQHSDGEINLGTLQFGQTKAVVVEVSPESSVTASLTYSTASGQDMVVHAQPLRADDTAEIDVQLCRSWLVDALRQLPSSAQADTEAMQSSLKSLASKVSASPVATHERVAALLEDLLGQCSEAVGQSEHWSRWGRHYVPSLMFAHKLQQCNNFKDPGVQFYGGEMFADIRDVADAAFNKLPAPKVTPAKYRYLGGGQLVHNYDFASGPSHTPSAASRPAVDMSMYNDRCGG
eukprot:TRINITY_DN23999_c0_g1_i1.p1 TRINITY_DN23999_c0_g1~~TRINITY_DN23999_c0_g1_i1.p1  ORF type:complete len:488 (+),score=97.66 TRINITY_DN23999_c0_g1_i1:185-1648(+)